MKATSHTRLASAKLGDDITLTRYIRLSHDPVAPNRRRQPKIPGLRAAFVEEGRTKFPTRVIQPTEMTHLLVSGHSNVKIGRDVRKGRFKGYWIYTLSLEERKTCPASCDHWADCYGNNMPFGKRVDHTHPEFLALLERDIAQLLDVRGRKGILIRLHALGDFYSPQYVGFWRRMLQQHPNLAIYGYTARHGSCDPIAIALAHLNADFQKRCMIRWSDGGGSAMSTVSILGPEACPKEAFVCPEQTAKTTCCATCGACWGTRKNVAFVGH